jgi:hypothetical protein
MGEGKIDVVLTSPTPLPGISLIIVVPLLGLGCDQVAKAHQRPRFKVESSHFDENYGEDQLAIQQCLLSITYHCSQSITIFALPQSLKEELLWAPLLQKLAEWKLYTLIVCNKAQTLPLHGCSFHREFVKMHKGVLESFVGFLNIH